MTESFLARSSVFREFLIIFQKLALANLLAVKIFIVIIIIIIMTLYKKKPLENLYPNFVAHD